MASKKDIVTAEGRSVIGSTETIIYVVDCSGSMNESIRYELGYSADPDKKNKESKIEAIRGGLKDFMTKRLGNARSAQDKTAVIIFGSHGTTRVRSSSKVRQDVDDNRKQEMLEDMAAEAGLDITTLTTAEREELERLLEEELKTAGGEVHTLFDPVPVTHEHIGACASMSGYGNTPMQAGLEQARIMAERITTGLVRIVLMTDGCPTDGTPTKIAKLVQVLAEDLGVIVDTVGVGPKTSSADKRAWDDTGGHNYNPSFLRHLAKVGKGEFFEGKSSKEISLLLQKVESERRALLGGGRLMLGSGAN